MKLLLGDEAIAQGALDAGLSGVYAYPGTPSTEITEYIQKHTLDTNIHSRWCTNESQPSAETFIRIAKALDVDVRELFNSTKEVHVGKN